MHNFFLTASPLSSSLFLARSSCGAVCQSLVFLSYLLHKIVGDKLSRKKGGMSNDASSMDATSAGE